MAIPDRNLALELIRVTETAALAAAPWVGRGQKDLADKAAVEAMRKMINTVDMAGVVVIGEGEKDNAPMLHNGESVGNQEGPACDVAVDPIDGTSLTANGMNGAISVIALAPRGSMYDPKTSFYMNKIVTGPEAAHVISCNRNRALPQVSYLLTVSVRIETRLFETDTKPPLTLKSVVLPSTDVMLTTPSTSTPNRGVCPVKIPRSPSIVRAETEVASPDHTRCIGDTNSTLSVISLLTFQH